MACKGYVNVEDLIRRCDPHYNDDNLLVEALRFTGDLRQIQAVNAVLFGPRAVRDAEKYERASRRMIEEGLARIR
jgi:hypothetical protein